MCAYLQFVRLFRFDFYNKNQINEFKIIIQGY